uniref:Uncharacterized protein n=1 Tax=Bursaphelenchus xylophilus TaxID=6326 RepID=A0A1I7SNB7_BURXY
MGSKKNLERRLSANMSKMAAMWMSVDFMLLPGRCRLLLQQNLTHDQA